MTDTHLTIEDRATFERLLAEYANAEMDCVRASGRRHSAMHAVHDYVNARTKRLITESQVAEVGKPRPFHEAEATRGAKHYKRDAPVQDCPCVTCCEERALSSIGTPAEGLPFTPSPAESGGN